MKPGVFKQCQKLFPGWAELSMADFEFDDPKGFSSVTMGIRFIPYAYQRFKKFLAACEGA